MVKYVALSDNATLSITMQAFIWRKCRNIYTARPCYAMQLL